jgi:hypothetical protein
VLPSAKHQGKDWAKHHANKQHSSSSSSTGADSDNNDTDHLSPPQDHSEQQQQQQQQEVINWQQAKVSFDDGKKYEIVKQIEHDPGAFTYVLRKFISLLFHVFFLFRPRQVPSS